MKNCYVCKKQLPFESFAKDKSQSSGYSSACRPCKNLKRAEHAAKNRQAESNRRMAWSAANPERQAAINAKCAAKPKSPERRAALRATLNKNNSNYRATKLKAMPVWERELTLLVLTEAHILARQRTSLFGFPWEVDHAIPLRAKKVCGLHVWNNIQVISRSANRKKLNKFDPERQKPL